MSTFITTDEFASVSISAGGRGYTFENAVLEVEDEADAKRIRTFAAENPHLEIEELDAPVSDDEPTPSGEVVADPSDPNDDGEPDEDKGDAPDPEAAAVEGAEAPEPIVTDADAPEAEADNSGDDAAGGDADTTAPSE